MAGITADIEGAAASTRTESNVAEVLRSHSNKQVGKTKRKRKVLREKVVRQNPYLEVEGGMLSENMSENEEAKQEDTRRAIGMKPRETGARENQVEEEKPQKEIQWPPECKTSTEGAQGEQNVVSTTSTSQTWRTTHRR